MSLCVQVDRVNNTRGYMMGNDRGPFKTRHELPGELFRDLMLEYGRCTGKMYIDRNGGGTEQHIGWCFIKREKYDDCNDTFLCETWVTVFDKMPEVRTINHFARLG